MANYATLKAAIQQVVKTNGNNEITGALLQQSLLAMISSLGGYYQFVGIATISTDPGTPDQNVFYLAGSGTYVNFGNSTIPNGHIGALKYNGSWSVQTVLVGKNYDSVLSKLIVDCALAFASLSVPAEIGTQITGWTTGGYYDTSGQYVANSAFKYLQINVDPTMIYRILCNNNSYAGTQALALFDENDVFLGGLQTIPNAKDFIFSGVSKIVISTSNNNNASAILFENELDIKQMSVTVDALAEYFDWDSIPIRNIQDIIIEGNLIKNARLIQTGKYVSSINADGTLNYTNNAAFLTYLLPVDGVHNYLFTYARFYVLMIDQEHAVSGASVGSDGRNISSVGANYIAFSFNATTYPVATYQIGIGTLQQETIYRIPLLRITSDNFADKSIENNKIADNTITTQKLSFVSLGKNLFNIDDPDVVLGRYLANNTLSAAGQPFNVTGYIPVQPNTTYQCSNDGDVMQGTALCRFVCQYDQNKQYITGADLQPSTVGNRFTTGASTYFVRVTVRNPVWEKYQIERGSAPTAWEKFGYVISSEYLSIPEIARDVFKKNNVFNSFRGVSQLANGESLTLLQSYARRKVSFVAKINGASASDLDVLVGLGYNAGNGGWLEITPTKVIVHTYVGGVDSSTEYSHGLTLANDIIVSFSANGTDATIMLISDGLIFSQEIDRGFNFGGAGFARNNGTTTINVDLAVMFKDITEKIWLFGDSYLGWANHERWPYWMVSWGFLSWLSDNRAGGSSIEGYKSMVNLLSIGKPAFILWANGMNDTSDANTTTPSADWLETIQNVIYQCEQYGITPILATIPTVPSKQNDGKNKWVRESGYRYVDFAAAVGATSSGVWKTGMLSGDNVHPTELGAKALASQVLIDFPEIMVLK